MERCQGCDVPFVEFFNENQKDEKYAFRMILTGGPALDLCDPCFHSALAWAARQAHQEQQGAGPAGDHVHIPQHPFLDEDGRET